jgi:hypothetical protein
MKKIILILFVISQLLFTSSIASVSPEAFTGPNGKTAFTLSCSGTGKDWNDCYQEADSFCPDGYNIIKKSTGAATVPVNGRSILAPSKKLVIECK